MLALGPLSKEIIEATFKYSNEHNVQLMLIASKNQIDHDGGYVNNWTTEDYRIYLDTLPDSNVLICRDHCGPGFNGKDIADCYKTVEEDIKNGFDLIHFDCCHLPKEIRYKETRKLIEYALKLGEIQIEIGTDENTGNVNLCADELKNDIEYFLSFCKPRFYVVQTGSLVKETQVGTFQKEIVKNASDIIHSYGLQLKEHNADYLTKEQIKERIGLVDAFNIAPQLGVTQTLYVVSKAKELGIDCNAFLEKSYKSNKWEKWTNGDKFLCAVTCGHYNFTTKEYLDLYEAVSKKIDLYDGIVQEIINIIEKYHTVEVVII